MSDHDMRCCIIWLAISVLVVETIGVVFADEVIPSDPPLGWWKGNIHTHTFWSDGNDFPEMVAEWYRVRNYNFLALSDHNILSEGERWINRATMLKRVGSDTFPRLMDKYLARFGQHWVETRGARDSEIFEVRLKPLNEFRTLVEERGKFIMMSGEEITDRVGKAPVHMNVTNLKQVIQPLGGATVREAMSANLRAAEQQARLTGREILVHVNHPNYGYGVTPEDLAAVFQERFVEVFNGHPSVNHLGDADHPGVERLWDIANTIRLAHAGVAPLFGIATDDCHEYHGRDDNASRPGRGWIMVQARYLTPETIIRAIKSGDFYASSGVQLRTVKYDVRARKLQLEIEAEVGVSYMTQFVGTPAEHGILSWQKTDQQGVPIEGIRQYSPQIGSVLGTDEGLRPSYQLTGNELYVRAVVTSSKRHSRPSYQEQTEKAWTQPVGWHQPPKASE